MKKTYLHGPMDDATSLKLRFRVGDLDLPGEERGAPEVRWRREKAHGAARVATQTRVEPR